MSNNEFTNNDKQPKKSLLATILGVLLEDDGEVKWSTYLGIAIGAGIIILSFYAAKSPTPWQFLAISLLAAGASFAAGVLIGFLFGIPRTLQKAGQRTDAAGVTGAPEAYEVNTNLEQISDWLTKIIVGVGLVQLTVIPGKLRGLADYLATAFGGQAIPSAMVLTIIVYFGIFGFLLGYLWARLFLTREFSKVERMTRDRPEYYEGLIHAYLYQPMPDSFNRAIKEGGQYITRFGDNERVWTYLACAYGQQCSYLKRAPKPDEAAIEDSRKKALDAVGRALQINPEAKSLLRNLWDPKIANAPENDLQVFFDDPAFKKLLADGDLPSSGGSSNHAT